MVNKKPLLFPDYLTNISLYMSDKFVIPSKHENSTVINVLDLIADEKFQCNGHFCFSVLYKG